MSEADRQQEYFEIHSVRYDYLISRIRSISPIAKILDVGAYPPYIFNQLEKLNYDVYGVASNHEKIKSPKIKILNIEKNRLPWPDNTFEIIIFTEVLEHLPHSALFPLKEMLRVLKPGGHLLLSTPNATRIHSRLGMLFGRSNFPPLYQHLEAEYDTGKIYHMHHKEYTREEVAEYLKKAGFSIKKSSFECFYPPTRSRVKQANLLGQVARWFSYAIQKASPGLKDSLFFDAIKA